MAVVLSQVTFDGGTNGATLATADSSGNNNVTVGTGNTATYDTTHRVGATGLGLKITMGTSASCIVQWVVTASTTRTVFRIEKVRVTTAVARNMGLITVRGASTVAGHLTHNSAGKLEILNSAAAVVTGSASTAALSTSEYYDIEFAVTRGTTTSNGVFEYRYFLHGSNTPIETIGPITGQNAGTASLERVRLGSFQSSTGTTWGYWADNLQAQTLATGSWIGAPVTDTVSAGADQSGIEPRSTVTLTATSSSGTVTWSYVSGINATLSGSGLTRTYTAPLSLAASPSTTWRATNGTATDDVTITYLPATDAICTSTNPVVLTPVTLYVKP